MLGRKPVNTFQETSVEFKKGTEFRLFNVKSPFSSTVTFETTPPKFAKAQAEQSVYIPHTEKETITKLFEDKEGFHVLNIEPLTYQIPGFCPKCKNHGVPKIEKKNSSDTRYRSSRYQAERSLKSKKTSEFWLVFTHGSASKCRISRLLPHSYPGFKPNKKLGFDFTKFVFPYYSLEDLEHQLSQ